MKIIMSAKRALDYDVKLGVQADGSGVDRANVRMSKIPHFATEDIVEPIAGAKRLKGVVDAEKSDWFSLVSKR